MSTYNLGKILRLIINIHNKLERYDIPMKVKIMSDSRNNS